MDEKGAVAGDDTAVLMDVVVLGGGLAGLAAATYAARGGAKVLLLEKAQACGGRAATQRIDGFSFNIGPHALYSGCEGEQVLRELGVSFAGRRPPVKGGLAFRAGRLHALPGAIGSLLSTGLLSLSGKLELARTFASIAKVNPQPLLSVSLRDWTAAAFRDQVVRELFEALTRLTGYANDPICASAGAAIAQLQRGLRGGVAYLDSGWQTLVDGLTASATRAGVSIETGQRVLGVRAAPNGAGFTVQGSTGACVQAKAVVMAVAPAAAASLYQGPGDAELARALRTLRPVKAACLDVALRSLPDPRALFCLGIDRPLYFSVHSASAHLAPPGGALVHVAKYLPGDDAVPRTVAARGRQGEQDGDDEAELERFCELLQPGWKRQVVERRYLPAMTVVNALVAAGAARPPSAVAGVSGLWVAGDWVGEEGMLADSALASAREAGKAAAVYVGACRGEARQRAA